VAGQEAKLEVRRQGYQKVTKTLVAPVSSEPYRVSVKLEPLNFELAVTSDPKAATILTGSRELGVTPANVTVPGGLDKLTLRKRCYDELSVPLKLPDTPAAAPIAVTGQLHKQPGCR